MSTKQTQRHEPYFRRWEVIILAGSILFTGVQSFLQRSALQAQERALAAQVVQAIDLQMGEITKVFLTYPELRPYFDDGMSAANATGDLKARIDTVAEMYLDFIELFDNEHVKSLPNMHEDGEYAKTWRRYFTDLFSRSPALCQRYLVTKDWYTERVFTQHTKAGCKKQ